MRQRWQHSAAVWRPRWLAALAVMMAAALMAAAPCMAQQSKVRKNKPKTEATRQQSAKTKTKTKTKSKAKAQQASLQGISTAQAVDLGLSVRWAGWNIGASSPEGYGGLYGWGDATGTLYASAPDASDYPQVGMPSSIGGDSRYDIATARWGGSWRLPTLREMEELLVQCEWQWGTYKGTKGYKVKGPSGKAIFLPAAGFMGVPTREVRYRGTDAYYWLGDRGNGRTAYYLYFWSTGHYTNHDYRAVGRSVRAVMP